MLSKREIKEIKSLQQKKYRRKLGQFLVEGEKSVSDILSSSYRTDRIILSKSMEHRAPHFDFDCTIIDDSTYQSISTQSTSSGVMAVVEIPEHTFDPDSFGDITLILDKLNDPGNLGTIIRTADWFGIKHIICSDDTVDLYNPKTVQSTMGSIGRVKVFYKDLSQTLPLLANQFTIFGLAMQGTPIHTVKSNRRKCIITGSEASGISDSTSMFIAEYICIPNFNNNENNSPESLNASIATAIACYAFAEK